MQMFYQAVCTVPLVAIITERVQSTAVAVTTLSTC